MRDRIGDYPKLLDHLMNYCQKQCISKNIFLCFLFTKSFDLDMDNIYASFCSATSIFLGKNKNDQSMFARASKNFHGKQKYDFVELNQSQFGKLKILFQIKIDGNIYQLAFLKMFQKSKYSKNFQLESFTTKY